MKDEHACPDLETLAAWAEGSLDTVARRKVLNHLDCCETCRETVGHVMSFMDAEESEETLSPKELPEIRKQSRVRIPFSRIPAIAAGIAAALFLFLIPRLPENDLDRAERLAAESVNRLNDNRLTRFKLVLPEPTENGAAITRDAEANPALEDSLTALEQVQEKNPDNDKIRIWLISLYLLKADYVQAYSMASKHPQQFKGNPDGVCLLLISRFQYAKAKADKGLQEEALSQMRQLYEAHPNNGVILYNLGSLLWDANREEEAIKIWNLYLEQEKQGPYADRIRARTGLK